MRVRNGKVSTTDGPFAETKEQLGGFYLIEARDLNDAIQVAAQIPSARTGSIEVRPIREFTSRRRMTGGRERGRGRSRRDQAVDAVYRADSRRVLATLIRLLGDFDLAEEALHDAFSGRARAVAARAACPPNPRAWLVSTGRFKAIDAPAAPRALRRLAGDELAERLGHGSGDAATPDRRARASTTTGCG